MCKQTKHQAALVSCGYSLQGYTWKPENKTKGTKPQKRKSEIVHNSVTGGSSEYILSLPLSPCPSLSPHLISQALKWSSDTDQWEVDSPPVVKRGIAGCFTISVWKFTAEINASQQIDLESLECLEKYKTISPLIRARFIVAQMQRHIEKTM